ncbi:DNA polymerase III subunit alpha [Alkalibacterium olivapovliticus]|uniref:DNA polymerase III subunit alpha n=1 Tax=Alkalibacterium olivapovliticus TaxID=99907 RepID=A0A2T0W1E3_9LACT|nr:DNA polymerase III subunit alpha [Alkalibacterium olivapovliticus]PRY78438.1 DNA polymerase-3 subunit alpha [Alkalibacterium olivapovliticus]
MSYTPLQVFSSYTLLKSTLSIKAVIRQAKELGYSSLALTDKNVMYGAVEFYKEAIKNDIKPLIGLTVDIEDEEASIESLELVLLARNNKGYQSLMSLSTDIMLNKKKITLNSLRKITKDIIVVLPFHSLELLDALVNDTSRLEGLFQTVADCLTHFYVSTLWRNETEPQLMQLKKTLNKLEIPLIVSEPISFLNKEDEPAAEVLQAIEKQETISEDSLNNQNDRAFLIEEKEVEDFYGSKSLLNEVQLTQSIVDDSQLSFDWHSILPKFDTPDGMSSEEYLEKTAIEWLGNRLPEADQRYRARLNKELNVINKMGFADYFLIVWDLMKFAHKNQIVTGSGRGSAAGSLVSYVLKITDVDPVEYDLLFDRFLNEERYTMPDIDLDFPDNKREQILSYVFKKYGSDHVAQIATFGTFAAKMAIRDTGRVYGLTSEELKQWSTAIPSQPGMTLRKAYKESASLRKIVNSDELRKKIFAIATKLEGLPRHVSTHAAGVVISKDPLINSTPLQEGSGVMPLTQYTMGDVEAVGLLKMDFLGLKNLTILSDCLKYTQSLKGSIENKLAQIPLNDLETLELFKAGETNGIFQFESSGIQRVLKKLEPSSFEDIVAVNALYRPGPMEQIDHFIARKKGLEPIHYVHEDLKDILEVTNGVIVYQEQVMKVASKIAGYTLSEADILRRAISKKIKQEIDAGRNQFVAGAKRNGYEEETARLIYDHIERFANYGFNRSHAVSYSKLAFQLAYFKTHYPAAFFVSLMRSTSNNKDKVKRYILEAKQRSISISNPDINKSETTFSVHGQSIIFGLDSIKGLRNDFITHIVSQRKRQGSYTDLLSFISRIDSRWRKEQTLLPLIKAGCFDQLGETRQTLIQSLASIIDSINMSNGNMELFESLAPRLEKMEEFSFNEKLKQEYEVTGFYLSGHPTEHYTKKSSQFLTVSKTGEIHDFIIQVESIKKIQTKRGEPMAFMAISDSSGEATAILFPDMYRKVSKLCKEEALLVVTGKAEWKKDELNIIVNKVSPLTAESGSSLSLYIRFNDLSSEKEVLNRVLSVLTEYKGETPVIIYDAAAKRTEKLKSKYNVSADEECVMKLTELLGQNNVIVK